ncbi:hypothetical protein QJQ45_019499 [Haematococcus lacustris]|nr:hypothetical protein QJQ45_019499 [Haematococcus lacustris]
MLSAADTSRRAWYTAVRLGLHSCTPRRPGTSLPRIVALYPQLTRLDLSQQEGLSPACLAPLTQLTALQELSLPSLQAEGQAPPEVSSPRVRSDARQAAGRRPSPSTAQPVALPSHPGCTAGIFPPAVCAPPAQPQSPSHCSPLQVHAVEAAPPLPSQPGEGEQQAGWPQGSGGAPSCPSLPQPASASSSPQPGLLPLGPQGCSLPAPPLGPPLLALLSGVTRLQARLCPALCPAGLACLTQLASLELDSLGAVSALQPLTRLHSLSLARLSCSEGLGGLASLTALTSLALCTDSGQLGEFLRPLSGLTALQQLSLRSSSMAEPRQHMVMDWAPLSRLRCLALRVSCEALRGAAGPLAAALTQLTSLALELYTATEAEPALCLTTPPALQHLHLASDRSRLSGSIQVLVGGTALSSLSLRLYWAALQLGPAGAQHQAASTKGPEEEVGPASSPLAAPATSPLLGPGPAQAAAAPPLTLAPPLQSLCPLQPEGTHRQAQSRPVQGGGLQPGGVEGVLLEQGQGRGTVYGAGQQGQGQPAAQAAQPSAPEPAVAPRPCLSALHHGGGEAVQQLPGLGGAGPSLQGRPVRQQGAPQSLGLWQAAAAGAAGGAQQRWRRYGAVRATEGAAAGAWQGYSSAAAGGHCPSPAPAAGSAPGLRPCSPPAAGLSDNEGGEEGVEGEGGGRPLEEGGQAGSSLGPAGHSSSSPPSSASSPLASAASGPSELSSSSLQAHSPGQLAGSARGWGELDVCGGRAGQPGGEEAPGLLAEAGLALGALTLDSCFLVFWPDLVPVLAGLPLRSLQLDNCLSVLDCELYALTHLTALTDLTLAGCHLITDQGLAALQLLPRLRHLTLRGLHKLGLGAAQAYARRQPLARRSGPRSSAEAQKIGPACPATSGLPLSWSSAEDVSGRFLRALHPLRALRALALRNMDGLQEAELVRGLRQLTRLTRLEVREVAAMSDAVMQRAVVRLACLRDLSVTYCRAVTDKGRQAVLAALGLGLAMDLEGCSVQDPARPVALVTDSSQAQLREELGCASHQQAALAQAKARRAHRRLQASGQREAGGQPGTALTLAAGGGWEGEELSPCSSDASVGLA